MIIYRLHAAILEKHAADAGRNRKLDINLLPKRRQAEGEGEGGGREVEGLGGGYKNFVCPKLRFFLNV